MPCMSSSSALLASLLAGSSWLLGVSTLAISVSSHSRSRVWTSTLLWRRRLLDVRVTSGCGVCCLMSV